MFFQVRWRKRRWAPKNASKIFYVPEKVRRSPEDEKVWRTKKQHYNTTLRAIRFAIHYNLNCNDKPGIALHASAVERAKTLCFC